MKLLTTVRVGEYDTTILYSSPHSIVFFCALALFCKGVFWLN